MGGGGSHNSRSARFRTICDRFKTVDDVQRGLREVGLESSNCKWNS
jgi:hypothetical protein